MNKAKRGIALTIFIISAIVTSLPFTQSKAYYQKSADNNELKTSNKVFTKEEVLVTILNYKTVSAAVTESAVSTKPAIKYKKGYVNTCNVNIRKKPNSNSKVLKVAKINKKIKYVKYDKKWLKLKTKGYISAKYVSEQKIKIPTTIKTKANGLNSFRHKNADKIAYIVCKNWKKYGVLPSVCVAQGIIESGLGESAPGYNYWGIASGKITYYTLESGVLGYLKCINNGYYKDAPFQTNSTQQIYAIASAYCPDNSQYAAAVVSCINMYNLNKYDEILFKYYI